MVAVVLQLMKPTNERHILAWCAFSGGSKTENKAVMIQRMDNFWKLLKVFWPEEKVDAWKSKIFLDKTDPFGTETVKNMICLTPSAHLLHSRGAFALRPVSTTEDGKQLVIEFHWLSRQERKAGERMGLLDHPNSTRGRISQDEDEQLYRKETSRSSLAIKSGTRITMTTDDLDDKPLPDPGLLELQWHLQRVFAMAGAADWVDDDVDHVSDVFFDLLRAFDQISEAISSVNETPGIVAASEPPALVDIEGWLAGILGDDRMSSPDVSPDDGL
jgi:hypothetical protein